MPSKRSNLCRPKNELDFKQFFDEATKDQLSRIKIAKDVALKALKRDR
jgi:hypothetical protein